MLARVYCREAPPSRFDKGRCSLVLSIFRTPGKRDEWLRFGARKPMSASARPVGGVTACGVMRDVRRLDATHHEVTFHSPLTLPVTADPRADARHLTAQALELIGGHMQDDAHQWWQWDQIPLRPTSTPTPGTTICPTLVRRSGAGSNFVKAHSVSRWIPNSLGGRIILGCGAAFLLVILAVIGSVWIEYRHPSGDMKRALLLRRNVSLPSPSSMPSGAQADVYIRAKAESIYMDTSLTLEQTITAFVDERVR